jgi:beta-N-acetylhexosaminidase
MTELTLPRAISATLMPGFDGPALPRWVADGLDAGLGSICLFDTNITEPDQLRTLTTAVHEIRPQALIATDEEGGDVTRLGHRRGSPYPSPAFLGRQDSVAATEAVGLGIGTKLRAAGIDMNLAPDADVNSNPRNPVIGVRSYGSDPQLVARHVAASVRGLHRAGVAACAKHFPGHGDTATDSHLDRPVVDVDPQTLAVRELVPFRAAVSAGVLAVMTSHILVPAVDADLPATLSPRVLALLRHDLGFDGVIVSDALDMAGASADRGIAEAAVLALRAGVDLMCVGSGNTGEQVAGIRAHIAEAVRSGRLAEARVLDAARRVIGLSAAIDRLRNRPAPVGEPPEVDAAHFWCGAPLAPVSAPVLLRLDSTGNPALAQTPWGVGEHLRPELDRWLPGATCLTVRDLDGVRSALAAHPGRPLVVQGRDLTRVRFLTDAVQLVRHERPDAIVAELGWPGSSGDFDVATFGAGRGAATSLIRLLASGSGPRNP